MSSSRSSAQEASTSSGQESSFGNRPPATPRALPLPPGSLNRQQRPAVQAATVRQQFAILLAQHFDAAEAAGGEGQPLQVEGWSRCGVEWGAALARQCSFLSPPPQLPARKRRKASFFSAPPPPARLLPHTPSTPVAVRLKLACSSARPPPVPHADVADTGASSGAVEAPVTPRPGKGSNGRRFRGVTRHKRTQR